MDSKRLNGMISRDAYVLEDESNPRGSKADQVMLSTTLDQVFDDTDPTRKNLRQIIEELKIEIITGGRGNIEFPVTSVNGQTGDVMLTEKSMNLDRIDNTSDMDKPLSIPQKSAIMDILSSYDFNVNVQDLYDHVADHNNPHQVTIETLNADHSVENMIQALIGKHNLPTNYQSHVDIRNRISSLWNIVDSINDGMDDKLNGVLKSLEDHLSDKYPHPNSFNEKESIYNKSISFNDTSNINHTKYPTTQSVVEYVIKYVNEFRETLPGVVNWIDDIQCVESRSNLPSPSEKFYRKAYFIRKGASSNNEIAICRINSDNRSYAWDYHNLGSYSKFSPDHFIDTQNGLDINLKNITNELLGEDNGVFGSFVANNYYNKEDIDNMHLINEIRIIPGTQNGTIRYYINNDLTTMSDDVSIPGLKRLAYLEWVTENELKDNSVRSKHIIDNAIERRHIQDSSVTIDKLGGVTYGTLLGNTTHANEQDIHEVKLVELADYLRPLIGGWPDPNVPGGSPWNDAVMNMIPHPHLMRVGEEHPLQDKSYIIRFTGKISCLPNMRNRVELSNVIQHGKCRLIEAGGSWCYQSNPEEWTTLGGSNITGSTSFSSNTFSSICMTPNGAFFDSISTGDRTNAEYDVWIRYFKPEELVEGEYNPI